ncbi:MAG: prenyltransferase/squalene oxidase repeat-containing protein, partial [Promethearchaeota archaeon]
RRFNRALILAFAILVMASPIAVMAAPTKRDAIVGFSVTCIDASGGAVLHLGASLPTVSNTFSIANVLNTTDTWIDADFLLPFTVLKENISAWVQDLQVTEVSDPGYGGFLAKSQATNATITASGHAVKTLNLVNGTMEINSTILVDFIVSLQRTNATEYPDTLGGFADTVNDTATVSATFFALEILDIYGELSQINSSLAIAWLNSSQILDPPSSTSYGGFTNGPNSSIADLQTTFMALRSLEILGSLSIIDQTAAIDYILPHYREDTNYPQYYGGFGLTPDDPVATHLATYYSIAALQSLGEEDQLSVEEITSWILSTQTLDGGFADSPQETGFAPQTNFAVSSLAALDQLETLLLPFSADVYVFPWWIVGIVVIVLIIVIFVIIARRAEWF